MTQPFENISDYISLSIGRLQEEKTKEVLLFFLLCVAINLIGGIDISSRKFLYLDMLGTALAGIALGPWWGASVGLVTNLSLYYMLPSSPNVFIFALVNVFGGLYWGYMCNLNILRPLEGITAIQKLPGLHAIKECFTFLAVSGGIVLSLPVFYILQFVLRTIPANTGLERYMYYMMASVVDKLLCVVIATVVICCFFPALASHLTEKKTLLSHGVSSRSIIWFGGLYFVPCCIYICMFPDQWFFWLIPYALAIVAHFFTDNEPKTVRNNIINLTLITYGALYWLIFVSVISFAMFVYFAVNQVTPRYDSYHVDGIIKFNNIIADAFSLSLVITLIGVVFVVLVQAVKQRESREVVRRVEWVRDKIATDIHNDPLQLVSVLRRKVSTVENRLGKVMESLENIPADIDEQSELQQLKKNIADVNKTFSNYYAVYLPELDNAIRKIIKPLSQKDTTDIQKVGLIQKIKDLIADFKDKNPQINVKVNLNVEEKQLPKKRSDRDDWKIEVVKILRELINNIEKHAKATTLYIDMTTRKVKGKQKLIIAISDNGIGFDPKVIKVNPNSFGLYEINTRAKDIGATINMEYLYRENIVNKGTIVMLEIPYDY